MSGVTVPTPSRIAPGAASLFDEVVGQPEAVAVLRRAAGSPVHAYLFVGHRSATGPAARGFAAALLCPRGGCGTCRSCRRALAGTHPDLVVMARTGAALGVDEARRLVSLAQRRPLEAARQVLVVEDVHLAQRAAPALLKTIEEPPGPTVFVLLAEEIPPELGTVASRCAVVRFPPVPRGVMVEWLVASGVDPDLAAAVAEGSGGDVDRARLLVDDTGYAARLELWRSLPARITGSGSVVAELADAVLAAAESALEPLRSRHAEQLAALQAEAESLGERAVPGRKEVVDRQHREERRWRTHELRVGLGVLARAYRDRMAAAVAGDHPAAVPGYQRAIELIGDATASLEHNPNETLLLQALLVRLGSIGD